MRTIDRRSLVYFGVALGSLGTFRRTEAAELAMPAGKPILEISGKIRAFNDGTTARFDRAMLEALGTTSFQTSTPWYSGAVTFEGVPMTTLLNTVGAYGKQIVVTALNDYTSQIPIADFAEFGVMIALKRDGAYMPVRDKGPLFIVYPYDSHAELRQQKYYSRSAWQVAKIVVK